MLPDPSENVFRICCASVKTEVGSATETTYKGVGERSHAGLSLLDDIDSSTGWFKFVQFYLGTWLQMRGVYPSYMRGQRRHGVAWGRYILVNGGQAE